LVWNGQILFCLFARRDSRIHRNNHGLTLHLDSETSPESVRREMLRSNRSRRC
jgi:hypothetical protein